MKVGNLTRALLASSLFLTAAQAIGADTSNVSVSTNVSEQTFNPTTADLSFTVEDTGSITKTTDGTSALTVTTDEAADRTHTVNIRNNTNSSVIEVYGQGAGGGTTNGILVDLENNKKIINVNIGAGATVRGAGDGFVIDSPVALATGSQVNLTNNGSIIGADAGFTYTATNNALNNSLFKITNSADSLIQGGTGAGIDFAQNTGTATAQFTIDNSGLVQSTASDAVVFGRAGVNTGVLTFTNQSTGVIKTDAAGKRAVVVGGTGATVLTGTLMNYGTIQGGSGAAARGILLDNGAANSITGVTNKAGGTISTLNGNTGIAIDFKSTATTNPALTNEGTITGDVLANGSTVTIGADSLIDGKVTGDGTRGLTITTSGAGARITGIVDFGAAGSQGRALNVNHAFSTENTFERGKVTVTNAKFTVNNNLGGTNALTGLNLATGANTEMMITGTNTVAIAGTDVTFADNNVVLAFNVAKGTDTADVTNNFNAQLTQDTADDVTAAPKVRVDLGGEGFIANGAKFRLMNNTGGNWTNLKSGAQTQLIQPNSAVLQFTIDDPGVTNQTFIVSAVRTSLNTAVANVGGTGAGGTSATNVGSVLEELGANSTALADASFQGIQGAIARSSSADLVENLNRLVPEVNGGQTQQVAKAAGAANNSAMIRVAALRDDASFNTRTYSAGHINSDWDIWLQGFGFFADQKNRRGVVGYDADNFGGTIGTDWKVNDDWRVGVAGSGSVTHVTSKHAVASRTSIDHYTGMVYGSWNYTHRMHFDGLLSYTHNSHNNKRAIVAPGLARQANSKFDSDTIAARVQAGYHYHHGKWQMLPSAYFDWSHVDIDGYTENGAGSANLTVTSSNVDTAILGLLWRARYDHKHARGHVRPEVRIGLSHDFAGDEHQTRSRFLVGGSALGGTMVTKGAEVAKTAVQLGAGLTAYTGRHLSVSVNYDYETKTDYASHTGVMEFRHKY